MRLLEPTPAPHDGSDDVNMHDRVAVTVIVVTHESVRYIEACLDSLSDFRAADGEVIVVDNASEDGTADLVATRYPDVQLVRGTRRRGFAANCNAGAAVAHGQVLLLLNPDARVRSGAIDTLVGRLLGDPAVGIVGPRLVYPDGRPQPSARRFPTAGTTLVRRTPLRLLLPNSAAERRHLMEGEVPDTATSVDWMLGAALVIRAEDYAALGGMDEGYRLYCEDIDLCWRMWERGRQVVLDPAAVVEHDLSELTRRRFFTRATLWHVRSMARFVRLHGLGRPPRRPTGSQT